MPRISELIDLSGQTALITGAAQGIGAASAHRLAEAGASVVVTAARAARPPVVAPRARARAAPCRPGSRSPQRLPV